MQRIALLLGLVLLAGAPLADAKAHTGGPKAPLPAPDPSPTPTTTTTVPSTTTSAAPAPDPSTPAAEVAPSVSPARAPAALAPALLPHPDPTVIVVYAPAPVPIEVDASAVVPTSAPEVVESASVASPVSRAWLLPILGIALLGGVALVAVRPFTADAKTPDPVRVVVPASDVASLLRAAQSAAKAQRFDEAVAHFDAALALAPDLTVAHFCRGVCLAGLARHADAAESLRRAHQLDPSEGAYRYELARACARIGRASEAMDALAPILRAAPELGPDVVNDEAFATLRDHPVFLALVGLL